MRSILCALALASAILTACGSDPPATTGTGCTAASQCYPTLNQQDLQGAVVCMDRVTGGYCTHHCVTDADCCAVAGECHPGFPQVCAPFESTGEMYCFLSCEGVPDEAAYCQANSNATFSCRSTGGGSANRKVCVP
jgi:hypothetical protein